MIVWTTKSTLLANDFATTAVSLYQFDGSDQFDESDLHLQIWCFLQEWLEGIHEF